MPKVKKSLTKDHFDKVDEKLVKCKVCGKILKTGGGTSNMLSHLTRKHPQAILETTTTSQQPAPTASSQQTPGEPIISLQQTKIQMVPLAKNTKKIDEQLTLMCATDFQPFTVVEDYGFRNFVEALNPNYQIPTRAKIRYEILPELYKKAKKKLEDLLKNVESLSVTTDLWTSMNLDSYISVTIHFYHENSLKSFVLNTVYMSESHTSAHLAATLNTILVEWNIKHKIVAIVTDNAPNMLKMCELLEIRNMPCFAHSLNLAVQDSLTAVKELEAIIEKCKRLVKYFKKSTLATNALNTEQKDRFPENEPLKLIQDVATRWNSIYHMLNRILLLSDSLAMVTRRLSQAPPFLTADEEEIVKELVKILNIFEQATKLLSGESYPTSSLVIPVICGLYDTLNTLSPCITTTIGKIFYHKVKESMNTRLLGYETRTVNRVATYLHPLYRNGFRQTDNMLAAKDQVRRELTQYLRSNASPTQGNITEPVEPSTSSIPSTSAPKLLDFLNKRKEDLGLTVPPNASAINILKMYLETSCEGDHNMNVGKFWEENKHLSPLGTIAYRYLCVPATSVPSERLFSTAGYVVGNRRTRLQADAVEMLCFLNRNRVLLQ